MAAKRDNTNLLCFQTQIIRFDHITNARMCTDSPIWQVFQHKITRDYAVIFKGIEADILKAIVDYLEHHKILYLRHNPVSVVSAKHGVARGFRKVRESQRGEPDLLIFPSSLWPQPLALEVKAPNGKQSDYQVAWNRRAIRAGLDYAVVRSFEEFMKIVRG